MYCVLTSPRWTATAWASMIYNLPFMTLMPLYGRLGDGLGKRRLLLGGMVLFLIGTSIVFAAPNLAWFMTGRIIQGIGTSGFVPLSLAMIAQWFAPAERGKVMGTWNSIIPLSGLIFPYFGGLIAERKARALLASGGPSRLLNAGDWLRDAMRLFEAAEATRPAGNDDARLRWNACARTLNAYGGLEAADDDRAVPVMLE